MKESFSDKKTDLIEYKGSAGKPHIKRRLRYIRLLATSVVPAIGQSYYYYLFRDDRGDWFVMDQESGNAGIGCFLYRLDNEPPEKTDLEWCREQCSLDRSYEKLVGTYPPVPFGFTPGRVYHFEFCVISV